MFGAKAYLLIVSWFQYTSMAYCVLNFDCSKNSADALKLSYISLTESL